MRSLKYIILTILLISVVVLPVFAPPGGSWNPGNTEPTVPISGGLVFLIASGIVYFFKKSVIRKKD